MRVQTTVETPRSEARSEELEVCQLGENSHHGLSQGQIQRLD